MRYFIYRNLHKEGYVYSIKALEGEYKGKVIGYTSSLIMCNIEFRVSEAGRERVRRERRKRVHAGIVGGIFNAKDVEIRQGSIQRCGYKFGLIHPKDRAYVTYNPYLNDTFVDKESGHPIRSADHIFILGDKLVARGINLR